MAYFEIEGGHALQGEIQPQGAKNEALQILCAVLLTSSEITISNIPEIRDVIKLIELLENLGVKVRKNSHGNYTFKSDALNLDYLDSAEFKKQGAALRGSIMIVGPLLTRFGKGYIPSPGGDKIGRRRLDTHFEGFMALGAKFEFLAEQSFYRVVCDKLKGAFLHLDEASVTGTANILLAAVMAEGETVIYNAACEPYLQQLCLMLNSMGAKIEGLGSPVISIVGVKKLSPATHATIADRIITGTWAFAAAMTKGDITIHGARPQDLELPLEKLTSAGAIITSTEDGIRVRMDSRPQSIDVSTLPYPGFPTDLLPMVIALNSIATGDAIVTENVFESRFMFVNELTRLGAQITVDGHHASIHGISQLSGAPVEATDIRAGAGLVLAALVSDGETTIEGAYHVDRGYPNFTEQLRALGADVVRE
jgi:UDP-N-acetylglucosamine 1-carboxyvinyltransferase